MIQADFVLVNANIYTMDEALPKAEAIALKGDKIIFAGTNDAVNAFIGSDTEVWDIEGKTVLPGLIESHVHVPGNAYNVLYNLNLADVKSKEETLERIRTFVAEHPERAEYHARGFVPAHFGGSESGLGPRKERLDEICTDKPIVVTDYGGHLKWMNSKAFETFGITAETKVHGGVVEIDSETGALWGTIKEEARYLAPEPIYSLEEKIRALKWFQDTFNAYGYTSVMALRPSANPNPVPIYDALRAIQKEECGLRLNVFGTREIRANQSADSQIEDLKALREVHRDDPLIDVHTAKFFVDGTVEAASAFLACPYEAAAGKGPCYYGETLWDVEELTKSFETVLSAGMSIHVHAIGDAAVTRAIDAMESAQKNIPGKHRNTITHLQVVKEEDIRRMKELDITACVNPFWHFKDPCVYFETELPFLGKERAEREFPLASFVKNGIRITSSGDHPITPYPNPFFAIMTGVTRNLSNAPFYGQEPLSDPDDPRFLLGKEERVSVMDMVKAYTINAAYANRAEDRVGSLTPGKLADLIVIDRDIFGIAPLDIEKTQILATIFHSKIVFERRKSNEQGRKEKNQV